MDYPGWDVETQHPIDPEDERFCQTCLDAVQPAIDMAIAWSSPDHGSTVLDDQGRSHTVVVRQVS
jgi:hypothetical protein